MKRHSKLICLVVLFMFISVIAFAEGDKGKKEAGDEKAESAKVVEPPPGGSAQVRPGQRIETDSGVRQTWRIGAFALDHDGRAS